MKTLRFLILSFVVLLVTVGASNKAPLSAPAKPGAVSPANGGLTTDYTPTLQWTNTAGIGGNYDIEVATDPSFGAYIIDSNYTFAGNTYTLGVVLDPAKTYYWHVQARDSLSAVSGWSITFTFRTAVTPPTMTDPPDSTILQNNRPTFKWTSVLNATGYNLQVSTTTAFSTVILNVTLPYTATQYTPTADLPANTTLYWRVRTLNSIYGPSDWAPGPIGNYFTISQTALQPSAPVLTQPANGKLTDDYTPRLVWKASSIPSATTFDYYEVQITTDKTFAGMDPVSIICSPPTCIDDTSVTTQVMDTSTGTSYFDVPDPGSTLNPATTYYWRVRAYNHLGGNNYYGNWSSVFSLRTTLAQVDPLISPADLSDLTDNRPTFDWTPVTSAVSYNIQISGSPTFGTLLINIGTSRPYKPAVSLPANKTLYWRVRGMNSVYGPGRWSDVWSFNSANPPSLPKLGQPFNDAILTNPTPTFTWSVSYLPLGTTFANYEIQITKDGTFATTAIDDTSATNQYVPNFTPGAPLDPISVYYWRVRACNTDGECSQYTLPFRFKTTPDKPTLVTYGGGSFSPPYDWNDVTGATSYTLQVSKSSTFGTMVLNINISAGTSQYTPSTSLPNGTYFWRVRTNNTTFGPSAFSAVDSFTVP